LLFCRHFADNSVVDFSNQISELGPHSFFCSGLCILNLLLNPSDLFVQRPVDILSVEHTHFLEEIGAQVEWHPAACLLLAVVARYYFLAHAEVLIYLHESVVQRFLNFFELGQSLEELF